jgi:hypothetical protein
MNIHRRQKQKQKILEATKASKQSKTEHTWKTNYKRTRSIMIEGLTGFQILRILFPRLLNKKKKSPKSNLKLRTLAPIKTQAPNVKYN